MFLIESWKSGGCLKIKNDFESMQGPRFLLENVQEVYSNNDTNCEEMLKKITVVRLPLF